MSRLRTIAAFAFSAGVFFITAGVSMRLTYGDYASGDFGPFWSPIEFWQSFMQERGLPQLGYLTSDPLIYSPAFALGLLAWRMQQRSRTDGHLHCTKCDHILKGLTAPRCPECGSAI